MLYLSQYRQIMAKIHMINFEEKESRTYETKARKYGSDSAFRCRRIYISNNLSFPPNVKSLSSGRLRHRAV